MLWKETCVFDMAHMFSSQGQRADKKDPPHFVKVNTVLLSKQLRMQGANMFMS